MLNLKAFFRSFKYAFRGLIYACRQQNFRFQCLLALIVIGLMLYFPLSILERIALLILIVMVLVFEILNTVFEKLADILRPRINPVVETVKDLMAAAVLISALASALIGVLIFYPYIF